MSNYDEIHRTLLTHVRGIRVISRSQLAADFEEIVAALTDLPQTEGTPSLDDYISTINSQITQDGMKITKIRSQVTNDPYFVFVNTKSDDIFKANSTFTVNELDAIKKLVDEIFESNLTFAIDFVQGSQVVAASINKSTKEAGNFIEDLVDEGWINITTHDQIILSMRGISELERYLVDRYGLREQNGNIFMCYQCKEIVTIGKKCGHCHLAFHGKCGDVWLKSQKLTICPTETCDFDWSNATEPIGVDADSVIMEEDTETAL